MGGIPWRQEHIMTLRAEGKEHATTMQKIKIWKRSHSSPVTIFSLYANVYKHVYRDFTKGEKEYQDTICSEAKKGNGDRPWEVLYDYVVDPATSQPGEETSGVFPLTERTFSSAFLELMTAGKHILGPYRYYFVSYDLCRLVALLSVSEEILVRAKNSNRTTMRTFSNFNLLRGCCTLLPFPATLMSLCAPGEHYLTDLREWHCTSTSQQTW